MSISIVSSNLIADLSQQPRLSPLQQMQRDFRQLSSALRSGDLAQAQSVFSQLQKDFQTAVPSPTAASPAGSQTVDQFVPSSSQPGLSAVQQVQQDYAQLTRSLRSGNLSGAQSAFAQLQQALGSQAAATPSTPAQGTSTPGTPSATGTVTGTGSDTISNDFNALGQALSSGNLGQAQAAFAQLQGDIKATQQSAGTPSQSFVQGLRALVQGHHHHHHGGHSTAESAETSSTTQSPAPAQSPALQSSPATPQPPVNTSPIPNTTTPLLQPFVSADPVPEPPAVHRLLLPALNTSTGVNVVG